MSPTINADFSKISSNADPLKPGTYRFRLNAIIDQENDPEWKSNPQNQGKSPALIFQHEVTEGDRAGTEMSDFVYVTSKEGKPIKRGLGRIKAYAEAIQGVDRANSPTGINTDELPQGEFIGIMEEESYTDNKTVPPTQKKTMRLVKILPVG